MEALFRGSDLGKLSYKSPLRDSGGGPLVLVHLLPEATTRTSFEVNEEWFSTLLSP